MEYSEKGKNSARFWKYNRTFLRCGIGRIFYRISEGWRPEDSVFSRPGERKHGSWIEGDKRTQEKGEVLQWILFLSIQKMGL